MYFAHPDDHAQPLKRNLVHQKFIERQQSLNDNVLQTTSSTNLTKGKSFLDEITYQKNVFREMSSALRVPIKVNFARAKRVVLMQRSKVLTVL